jgi:23S rRNA (cytidine1920-2'-O)/16S rRNA (cytidine1409-2'-O)-methyltransferase
MFFMKKNKQRLDTALVERGLAESRARAQSLIYAGQVRIEGQSAVKPSQEIEPGTDISLAGRPRFASRGGDKLDRALDIFEIKVSGRICLDAGASTGGFTDCLLQRGAQKVFAVDVGTGQIHWKLSKDPRVIVMDKTNARHLAAEMFPEKPELAAVDVSFISLTKVLPAVINVMVHNAPVIALVKPQFEAERRENKRGVVRDPAVRARVVEMIKRFGIEEAGLDFRGICESPLKGPAGNVEFFIYWIKP